MVGYVGNVKTRPLTILGVRLKAEQPELTEEQKDEVIHITGENLYNEELGMTGSEIRQMLLREDKNYADFEFRGRERLYPLATRFTDCSVSKFSKELREMQSEFRQMSEAAMSDFIEGKGTIDDMMNLFEKIVDETFEQYTNKYYIGDNPIEKSALLSYLYKDFRYDINTTAVMANHAEGRQYVEYNPSEDIYYSEDTYCNNYYYYNAEYYYKAKEALTALENKVMEMAERKGIDGYSAPTDLLPMYNNFNTCKEAAAADPHILDTSKEPPRDFKFFCQERPPVGRVIDKMVLDENGNVEIRYPDPPKTAAMEYCAIIKVWGSGWSGTTKVPYKGDINDFHNLATVFSGKNVPKEIRDYMTNFQFYSHAGQSAKYWADKYGIGSTAAGRVLGYA